MAREASKYRDELFDLLNVHKEGYQRLAGNTTEAGAGTTSVAADEAAAAAEAALNATAGGGGAPPSNSSGNASVPDAAQAESDVAGDEL